MSSLSPVKPGDRYCRLVVIRYSHVSPHGKRLWLCRCDCGGERIAIGSALKGGKAKSCGCMLREHQHSGQTTHGMSKKGGAYRAWAALKERCLNPNSLDRERYGGRGITVCVRWKDSFEDFLADMGERPSAKHSIDRYPDNNGNYEPGNCRWATVKEQNRNRRSNLLITINDATKCLAEWCEVTGIDYDVARNRINRGWDRVRAVTEPVHTQKRRTMDLPTVHRCHTSSQLTMSL